MYLTANIRKKKGSFYSNYANYVLFLETNYSIVENVSGTFYYDPFGMLLPEREWKEGYRFGFGGQEIDFEINANRNHLTAEFWEYTAELGRRYELDPICTPNSSGYSTFGNNPIFFVDRKGDNKDWYYDVGTDEVTYDSRVTDQASLDALNELYGDFEGTYLGQEGYSIETKGFQKGELIYHTPDGGEIYYIPELKEVQVQYSEVNANYFSPLFQYYSKSSKSNLYSPWTGPDVELEGKIYFGAGIGGDVNVTGMNKSINVARKINIGSIDITSCKLSSLEGETSAYSIFTEPDDIRVTQGLSIGFRSLGLSYDREFHPNDPTFRTKNSARITTPILNNRLSPASSSSGFDFISGGKLLESQSAISAQADVQFLVGVKLKFSIKW